jgi:histidine triad (HIT) family protein
MISIFTKIINRELPSKIFYETDEVIVIEDINPKATIHLLIIPKIITKNFYATPAETLNLLNETVKEIARMLNLENRFRLQINNGLGQEIEHLHYHFMSDCKSEKLIFLN